MAFKLQQSATFKWPVEFEVPGDGRPLKGSFTGEFVRLPQSEIDAHASASETDRDFVPHILSGWSGVTDADGVEVEYTPANRARLLEVPGMASVIVRTFFEALAGSARRKN